MVTRVGINGFGRIGRQTFRALLARYSDDIEIVAINDLADVQTNAHLFKYDSIFGRFPGEIEIIDDLLGINQRLIKVFSFHEPSAIPWHLLGVDIVIEATGSFTNAKNAAKHKKGSVKKIIVSAPAVGEDLTIVFGVNEHLYNAKQHAILSAASCTTNCLAPTAKVLDDAFGIERGLMTTIHSITNAQQLLDQVHPNLRRARAAGVNIIPTPTDDASILSRVMPELAGRCECMSLRVPTINGAVVDLVVTTKHKTSVEEINAAFKEAAHGSLCGVLSFIDDPIVSSDIREDAHSSIIDGLSTMYLDGNMLKVLAWYNNEWGYANRIADLTHFVAQQGL